MDIVERLRDNIRWLKRDGFLTSASNVAEALDEIEHLHDKAAEREVEIGRLLALDGDRCKVANSYIIDNARLAEKVEQLQAELDALREQEPVGVVRNCSAYGLRVSIMDAGLTAGQYLYAAPQPDVPEHIKTAIGKLLANAMDIAVQNGADSRSMPDEYVAIAAWLCNIKEEK